MIGPGRLGGTDHLAVYDQWHVDLESLAKLCFQIGALGRGQLRPFRLHVPLQREREQRPVQAPRT